MAEEKQEGLPDLDSDEHVEKSRELCSEVAAAFDELLKKAALAEDHLHAGIRKKNRTPAGRNAVGIDFLVIARNNLRDAKNAMVEGQKAFGGNADG